MRHSTHRTPEIRGPGTRQDITLSLVDGTFKVMSRGCGHHSDSVAMSSYDDGPLCSLEDLLLSLTLSQTACPALSSSAPQPPNVVSQKITFLIVKTLDFDLSHS